MLLCSNCGKLYESGKFCRICGGKLKNKIVNYDTTSVLLRKNLTESSMKNTSVNKLFSSVPQNTNSGLIINFRNNPEGEQSFAQGEINEQPASVNTARQQHTTENVTSDPVLQAEDRTTPESSFQSIENISNRIDTDISFEEFENIMSIPEPEPISAVQREEIVQHEREIPHNNIISDENYSDISINVSDNLFDATEPEPTMAIQHEENIIQESCGTVQNNEKYNVRDTDEALRSVPSVSQPQTSYNEIDPMFGSPPDMSVLRTVEKPIEQEKPERGLFGLFRKK